MNINIAANKLIIPTNYETIGTSKANFDEIYEQKDPRSYYSVLGSLDYVIPDVAFSLFHQIITCLKSTKKRKLTILDLGCSYGINPALLKHRLKFSQLFDRYTSPAILNLSPEEVIVMDENYFKSWPIDRDIKFIGLDTSAHALNYAQQTGIIEDKICVNLEEEELSDHHKKLLQQVDLIISTGCIGYITFKTFQKIMNCYTPDNAPWVASFVLRMFPYSPINEVLKRYSLTTEKLKGTTFIQRRFESQNEFEETIKILKSQKKAVRDKEEKGFFHTEFFLSRPQKSVEERALIDIVSLTTGISKLYKLPRS